MVVAVAVGSIEVLGLLANGWVLRARSGIRSTRLNDNADSLGFVIIGVFVSIWIGAIVLYRYRRRDEADAAAD